MSQQLDPFSMNICPLLTVIDILLYLQSSVLTAVRMDLSPHRLRRMILVCMTVLRFPPQSRGGVGFGSGLSGGSGGPGRVQTPASGQPLPAARLCKFNKV